MKSMDDLLFPKESDTAKDKDSVLTVLPDIWKVLIVDDEEEVHNVTKLALKRFTFEGKGIRFFSAYSAAQGKKILAEHPDMAVVLLDVVMEEEDAGLKMAHFIRRELSNKMVRIILRTGQPGQAPENDVIMEYDINDYKEKTELTTQKLHTTMVTALRSFQDLSIIDTNRRGLQKIIESSASIFQLQSMTKFACGALTQLVALLHLNPNALYGHASSFAATKKEVEEFQVLAATGEYEKMVGGRLKEQVNLQVLQDIEEAYRKKQSIYFPDRFVIYFCSKPDSENVIYLDGVNSLNEWDKDLIEIFCMNISVAFDNIYLNQEVEDTQKEILFTLGEVAEARSQETGFHVKRVAELAKLLALRYGLSEGEAELLRLATPIHDLGKLGISDTILNKPGKLTPEEFAIMKTHSEIGYEMLKNSGRPILKAGSIIAWQHHERYDGKGYPLGLKGEEIHIYSRIVALADVFDALGNERVYKKAWPLPEIIEYIKEQAGTHFDPKLVKVFLENIDEMVQVRSEFPD